MPVFRPVFPVGKNLEEDGEDEEMGDLAFWLRHKRGRD